MYTSTCVLFQAASLNIQLSVLLLYMEFVKHRLVATFNCAQKSYLQLEVFVTQVYKVATFG